MANLNTINNLSISEQRENLLKLNPDLIYGVYDLKEDSENKITLENMEEIMTCYPNQFENLKGLEENSDIGILDLGALRRGEIKFLNKNNSENYSEKKLVLLSNGVIEVVKANYKDENGEIKQRNHFPLTLRDGGTIDQNQRTSVAGRNVGNNLNEEVDREYAEESPFLGKGKDSNYYLFTPENENKQQVINDLKDSVKSFLKNKYNLDRNKENDLAAINLAEKSLRVKYEDLGKILEEIIENDRIDFFESKTLDNLDGLNDSIKEIKTTDSKENIVSSGKFFTFFDEANNTIEYRALREIKIPEGVRPTSRLFLESQNQGVINARNERLTKEKLVPTMKYFSDKVNNNL